MTAAALFDDVARDALLSDCELVAVDPEHDRDACLVCDVYRYVLTRIWNASLPLCVWVMLNPSKADRRVDDATIKKCMRFARKWGYGGVLVLNLYGLRATDRRELWRVDDPIGPENDKHLLGIDARLMVVCAWGADGRRGDEVLAALIARGVTPYCLATTKAGAPTHPLYLKESLTPVPLRQRG
jgi:hypothetical protein